MQFSCPRKQRNPELKDSFQALFRIKPTTTSKFIQSKNDNKILNLKRLPFLTIYYPFEVLFAALYIKRNAFEMRHTRSRLKL